MTVVYDVTTFASPTGTSPFTDIGKVINEIITDIKAQQATVAARVGAVVYIPPGTYDLLTQVLIDISFLQIKGSGHGFLSQETQAYSGGYSGHGQVEQVPGGSHIRVRINGTVSAFRLYRSGQPWVVGRLNSVEFRDFCIDGGADKDRPYTQNPKRIGISADSHTDSVRIEGMGFTFLRTAIVMHHADGVNITNNFICEVGAGVELYGNDNWNPTVVDNTILPSWDGAAILVDGATWPYIANNILDYWGNIRIQNCADATVIGNRINSWWVRQISITDSHDCFVSGNHIGKKETRDVGTGWQSSSLIDTDGIIYVSGDKNTITNNLLSVGLTASGTNPPNTTVAAIKIAAGSGNFVTNNRVNTAGAAYNIVIASGVAQTRVIYSAPAAQIADSGTGTQIVATP